MVTRMPSDADRTAALDMVIEVAILLSADMDQALAADGLTPARVRLVWELGRRGPSTQRDLAAALDVTARNITGLVDALTESGHVTRERHPTDRRATLVTFTEHGEAVVRKLQEGHVELAELLFAGMPATTFRGLSAGLESVVTILRELVTPPTGEPS